MRSYGTYVTYLKALCLFRVDSCDVGVQVMIKHEIPEWRRIDDRHDWETRRKLSWMYWTSTLRSILHS